jgi:tetratricopeptide (TPR) repeat protein
MTTLSPITLKCLICEKYFESNEIGSCGFANKRTDFRPNYWGFNPVNYFYHLCPHCGFCASKAVYEMDFDASEFRKRINELGPLKEPALSQKLERAMQCLEIANELGIANVNDLTLANNWIEPYWWAETEEEIKKYGEIALKYFYNAFKEDLVFEDEVISAKYLMGEINRRIGNQEEAIKLFDEVIALAENDPEAKETYDLAVQQKTNPKENLGD